MLEGMLAMSAMVGYSTPEVTIPVGSTYQQLVAIMLNDPADLKHVMLQFYPKVPNSVHHTTFCRRRYLMQYQNPRPTQQLTMGRWRTSELHIYNARMSDIGMGRNLS